MEWQNNSACRKSKKWLPEPNLTRTKQFLALERTRLGKCMQWITGFCNLQGHRHTKRARISPRCRLCDEETEETAEHITFQCGAAREVRVREFNDFQGPSDEWSPTQLDRFISNPSIARLLVDHTDYSQERERAEGAGDEGDEEEDVDDVAPVGEEVHEEDYGLQREPEPPP